MKNVATNPTPAQAESAAPEWFSENGVCLTCGKTREAHPLNRHDFADRVETIAVPDRIPGPLAPFPGLDFTRPLRTKGGQYPVRILAIDYSLRNPVIGVIVVDHLKDESNTWSINGTYLQSGSPSGMDLENYEPAALETAKPSAEAQPSNPSPEYVAQLEKALREIGDSGLDRGSSDLDPRHVACIRIARAALSQSTPNAPEVSK